MLKLALIMSTLALASSSSVFVCFEDSECPYPDVMTAIYPPNSPCCARLTKSLNGTVNSTESVCLPSYDNNKINYTLATSNTTNKNLTNFTQLY